MGPRPPNGVKTKMFGSLANLSCAVISLVSPAIVEECLTIPFEVA